MESANHSTKSFKKSVKSLNFENSSFKGIVKSQNRGGGREWYHSNSDPNYTVQDQSVEERNSKENPALILIRSSIL
jgi:hypothetical protein